MKRITDLIPILNQRLEEFKTSIDILINQNNKYIYSVRRYENKQFKIEENKYESLEQRKNRADTLLDQLDDIYKRNKIEIENMENFETKLNEMKSEIDKMKNNFANEQQKYEEQMSEIKKIVVSTIESMKMKEINPFDEEIEKLREQLKRKEEERIKISKQFEIMKNQYSLTSNLNDTFNYKKNTNMSNDSLNSTKPINTLKSANSMNSIETTIHSEFNNTFSSPLLEENEKKQIEQWTKKKYGEIIFDSEKDDWNSHFPLNEKIMNKSNLVFVIEDENNNKFGGYLNEKIDKICEGFWNSNISDSNAFVFSLQSNGRLNGMMKFGVKDVSKTFLLWSGKYDELFQFGSDIVLYKQSKKISFCNQKKYDYHGLVNALCGEIKFNPKRFNVIQLF